MTSRVSRRRPSGWRRFGGPALVVVGLGQDSSAVSGSFMNQSRLAAYKGTRDFYPSDKRRLDQLRWYSCPRLWRYEQPQPGRLREALAV